jgi:hypothetical protein
VEQRKHFIRKRGIEIVRNGVLPRKEPELTRLPVVGNLRFDRDEVAIGLPAFAMSISSPDAAPSASFEECFFASRMLNVSMATLALQEQVSPLRASAATTPHILR